MRNIQCRLALLLSNFPLKRVRFLGQSSFEHGAAHSLPKFQVSNDTLIIIPRVEMSRKSKDLSSHVYILIVAPTHNSSLDRNHC